MGAGPCGVARSSLFLLLLIGKLECARYRTANSQGFRMRIRDSGTGKEDKSQTFTFCAVKLGESTHIYTNLPNLYGSPFQLAERNAPKVVTTRGSARRVREYPIVHWREEY